jgi:amino acid transporter
MILMSTAELPSKTGPSVYLRKTSGLIRSISARDALMSNLVAMGLVVNIWWVVWASLLYPAADLPSTVFIALVANLVVAFVYWMLSTAMPRTGGDYVYVGRILHPAIGFMVNFLIVTAMITWVGMFAQLNAAYFMPTMLINLAHGTGNSSYLGLAAWMTTADGQFIAGVIMVTIVFLVMLAPVKWIFRVLVAVFVIQAVIYIWFIAALLPLSHTDFVQAFNAKSGTTVEAILDAAKSKAGVDWTITAYGTFIGIVYTSLSFIGYANSAYFAGEVGGDPRRSQGLAIFVSPFIFAAAIYVLYALVFNVFGHDFMVAASTLALNGDPSIAAAWNNYAATIPTPAYLVSFISDSLPFIVAVPLGLVLTAFGFAITYFFVPVRNIFAWAFDRTIPLKFADVDRRGVPWVSTILYGIIAYISCYLAVYTTVFQYFAYTNFGWFLAIAIVMFSAAIFPWRRKDIYGSAPSIVKAKIGPLPLVTLAGVIAGILSLWVSYSSIIPAYTGSAINPVYVFSMLVIFAVGLIIYAISYAYHKSKGLPIDLAAKELPPL